MKFIMQNTMIVRSNYVVIVLLTNQLEPKYKLI